MGHGTKVGQGEAEVVTKKDLLVRLQAPRFFVQKDEVVLSANVHNYLKTDKKRRRSSSSWTAARWQPLDAPTQTVKIAAGGEQRVDWRVKVAQRGRGRRPHEGAHRRRVRRHGDDASRATSTACSRSSPSPASIRPDKDTASVDVQRPRRAPHRRRSRLEVRYSPTLAGAMVDALPYLVDYPYGCTEQTLNRFLPTVITQKILHAT